MKQDDDLTGQSVNQSSTTEDDSERAASEVKVQEKVQTTWFFVTRAHAQVMPQYVWEHLGELTQQTTRETLRGANGQDLGAMGELLVRGFLGKIKVQCAVHSGDCKRRMTMPSEWNATQKDWVHVHVESTRESLHTTIRRRKSNDVPGEIQKNSQSCVHVEAKRCTIGNLPDVETRIGKCETRIAILHDW